MKREIENEMCKILKKAIMLEKKYKRKNQEDPMGKRYQPSQDAAMSLIHEVGESVKYLGLVFKILEEVGVEKLGEIIKNNGKNIDDLRSKIMDLNKDCHALDYKIKNFLDENVEDIFVLKNLLK